MRRGGDSARAEVRKSASAAASSCADGTIRWVTSTEDTELIAVSPVVDHHPSDGMITYPLVLVRTFEPRVEVSEKSVSDRRVFASLARHVDGDASVLSKPWSEMLARVKKGVEVGSDGPGRFVQAVAVDVLRASFTVDRPGAAADSTPVHGSVTAWSGSSGAGLQCGVDSAEEGGKASWVQEAYDLACGTG